MDNVKNITNDDQYLDLRNCSDATLDVDVLDEIGMVCDPFDCQSKLGWFKEGEDYDLLAYEPGEISFNTEDKVGDEAIKQIEVTQIDSWTRTFEFQAKYGSNLLNFFQLININESTSERDGDGLVAYANGGLYTRRTWTYNKGKEDEFVFQEVVPNIKVETWPDVFSGKMQADTSYAIDLVIQDFPHYYLSGVVPDQMFIPDGVKAPVLSYSEPVLTDTELTISGMSFEDTDGVTDQNIDKPIFVQVFSTTPDVDGNYPLIVEGSFDRTATEAVLTADFATETSVNVTIGYALCENLAIPKAGMEVVKTAAV